MSTPIVLTAGFGDYDRTRALHRQRIPTPGVRLVPVALPPSELFPRAFQRAEFDVSELSASTQLIALSRGSAAYVALPVFLSRSFRFDAIYVRSDSGIEAPGDLAGRSVGVPEFQMTAAVWIRGILRDRYGLDLKSIRHRTGGLNEPGRKERIPLRPAAGWTIEPIGDGVTLDALLRTGELDAIIAPQPPQSFLKGDGAVRRLFRNSGREERAYFEATGIFPIMHVLGIRKTILEARPHLAQALFAAFLEAKDEAFRELDTATRSPAPPVSLPWLAEEVARTRALMGPDPWPYGCAANEAAIETLCRYAFEQGLLDRPVSPAELFPVAATATPD